MRSHIQLGLIGLASITLASCAATPSTEVQCQKLYQSSKDFRDYKGQVDELTSKVYNKYLPELPTPEDGEELPSLEYAAAYGTKFVEAIEKNKTNIHRDLAVAHKEFATQLNQSAKTIKDIKVTGEEIEKWHHSVFHFYSGRGDYHEKQAKLFKKMGELGDNFNPSAPKIRELNDEINSLHDWVNEPWVTDINTKNFLKFKKYCADSLDDLDG